MLTPHITMVVFTTNKSPVNQPALLIYVVAYLVTIYSSWLTSRILCFYIFLYRTFLQLFCFILSRSLLFLSWLLVSFRTQVKYLRIVLYDTLKLQKLTINDALPLKAVRRDVIAKFISSGALKLGCRQTNYVSFMRVPVGRHVIAA